MTNLIIRLSDDLHKELRLYSVNNKISMQKIVEGLIGLYLFEQKKASAKKKKPERRITTGRYA